jgi:hypothetical protein
MACNSLCRVSLTFLIGVNMKKERWIPKGYDLIAKDERYGLEVFSAISDNGRIYAIAYGGKRTKCDWHYGFKTETQLKAKIEETLEGYIQWEERKAKYKAERNRPHNVKVGDIFRCSWGYDQTNIDFYQCTKVLGAFVEIREIGQMAEETLSMQGECVPCVDAFKGDSMRKKVVNYGDTPAVRIYSFASAYRMNPIAKIGDKAVYESSHWTAYA